MRNNIFDEIKDWDIRYPILIENEYKYKNAYPIRVNCKNNGYVEFDIERKLFHFLRLNCKIKDLDENALSKGYIVVKKEQNVVLCNFKDCTDKCMYYSQCVYCSAKKLQEANL
jgi:hypothetical protein